ncbi:hypothetical protein GWI33_022673 [Rhynchophorus ferrugineus]|uniref:Uncharacterized protein n=1 Tax=Rhynchophorus ferrugineus TaxID=354439 RepID=A0A834MMG9_RHYFE|nr:hypothetical protein GWI33_022673 [Rhynchophorus ferrugineus]
MAARKKERSRIFQNIRNHRCFRPRAAFFLGSANRRFNQQMKPNNRQRQKKEEKRRKEPRQPPRTHLCRHNRYELTLLGPEDRCRIVLCVWQKDKKMEMPRNRWDLVKRGNKTII